MKIADLPAAIPSSQSVSRAAQRNFRTSFSAELTRARTGNGLKSIEAADQAGQLQPVTYSVKAGDTLTSIARQWIEKNGGDATEPAIARVIQTISKASGISNPDVIRIGQVLDAQHFGVSRRGIFRLRRDHSQGAQRPKSNAFVDHFARGWIDEESAF